MKKWIPIIAVCGLLLASCASQRGAAPKRYQTLQEKANVTLQLGERNYTMSASVQLWRNELIILSLQPMLGIEMVRAEVTKDSVLLVDKMNRRYVALDYETIKRMAPHAPSYKMIQEFVSLSNHKKRDKHEIAFEMGKHTIQISCTFTQREYNTLKTPKRTDLKKYKPVSLRDILPI